ncbi:hypothetical protein HC928_08650 [bacterium]|nr:hypothetical protein [bacterium]
MNLPRINIRYVRPLLAVIAAAVFMGALILGLALFKDEPAAALPNALWLGEEWTHTARDDADVAILTERLRDFQIGTVYAWVSWLQPDNIWAGGRDTAGTFTAVEPQVQTFARQFKAAYPDAMLYGWLRVPVGLGDDYRLDDEALIASVTAFGAQLVNRLGFDGVFLEVGPVLDGDTHFVTLLQRLRSSIGPRAALAAALPPDWTPTEAAIPKPALLAEGLAWSTEYKQRVALLVDQVVVQAYNSYLDNPADYVDWMAYQVTQYALAVDALDSSTEVVISLPVYAASLPAHNTAVENLNTAINGVRRGLSDAGSAAAVITGVALYADWDMDADAWSLYRSAWINR